MLLVATAVMVALGEAGKAALRAFFGTKRGTRQLIESPPSSRTWGVRGRAQAARRTLNLRCTCQGAHPARSYVLDVRLSHP